ncbi:hypothetical protein [Lysinibacillus sphaericus]|uniref:hypothetical protein n=1 Tax=Lysinibacillus sphaericus TaxID=1421 RepID=UPI0018CD91D8|nr:hypothetical protein [Lysinibacillus sphaericus]MBG9479404.1 hypothetical protein [Lysinibacillus sphaericus]MBG9479455.1 hypothetical protein [Lysinibacillus sphaericus]
MLEQSKVDAMNDAVADFVIKRVGSLNPELAKPNDVSSLAALVKEVNAAPKTIHLIGESIKPLKRKRRR